MLGLTVMSPPDLSCPRPLTRGWLTQSASQQHLRCLTPLAIVDVKSAVQRLQLMLRLAVSLLLLSCWSSLCNSVTPHVHQPHLRCLTLSDPLAILGTKSAVQRPQLMLCLAVSLLLLSCWSSLCDSLTLSARQQHLMFLSLSDPLAILGVKSAVQRPQLMLCLPVSLLLLSWWSSLCNSVTPHVHQPHLRCLTLSDPLAILGAKSAVQRPQLMLCLAVSLLLLSCWSSLCDSLTLSARQQHLRCLTLSDPLAILGAKSAVQRPQLMLCLAVSLFLLSCWSSLCDSLTLSARQQHLMFLTFLAPLATLGAKSAVQRPQLMLCLAVSLFLLSCWSSLCDSLTIAVCCLGGTNDAVLGCVSSPLLPFFPRFVDTVSFVCPEVL